MKYITEPQLFNTLQIDPFEVNKIRQLTSKLINIVFIDGHSVNFKLSNSLILK